MINKKSNMILDEWASDNAELIVKDIIMSLSKLSKDKENRDEVAILLAGKILQIFVASLLYGSLTQFDDAKKYDKKSRYDLTYESYKVMKEVVQFSISDAFMAAFFKFSGIETDYWCTIKPVGQPANKLPI